MSSLLVHFAQGVLDAVNPSTLLRFVASSSRIQTLIAQCLVLNLCVFLGSILVYHNLLAPLLAALAPQAVLNILMSLFQTIWLYPAYCVSYLANCMWYDELGRLAHRAAAAESSSSNSTSKQPPIKPRSWDAAVAQELYKLILLGVYFIQVFLVNLIAPEKYMIKGILNHILLSWAYAFYCFDYRWSCESLELPRRVEAIETRWAYFLGFGTPSVLSAYAISSDALVGAALCSALYPLFVVAAAAADVPSHGNDTTNNTATRRLPIFTFADAHAARCCTLLCRALLGPSTTASRRRR